MRPDTRKFLQRRHHVKGGGIAIGILALRQRAGFFAMGAAADVGQ